jgi:hypothetical protein
MERNKIAEIITQTHKTPLEQADEILLLFGVSGSAVADLSHIAINSAMNIQCLTDNEPTIQEECGKIINAIRVFSKHYA